MLSANSLTFSYKTIFKAEILEHVVTDTLMFPFQVHLPNMNRFLKQAACQHKSLF